MSNLAIRTDDVRDDPRLMIPGMLRQIAFENLKFSGTVSTQALIVMNERRISLTSRPELDAFILRSVRKAQPEPRLAPLMQAAVLPSTLYRAGEDIGLVLEREGRFVHIAELVYVEGWMEYVAVAPYAPLNLQQVKFSRHAFLRFRDRYRGPGSRSLVRALTLLGRSSEANAITPLTRVRRIVNNGFREVRYFRYEDWRFILREENDGTFCVITFELIERGRL